MNVDIDDTGIDVLDFLVSGCCIEPSTAPNVGPEAIDMVFRWASICPVFYAWHTNATIIYCMLKTVTVVVCLCNRLHVYIMLSTFLLC